MGTDNGRSHGRVCGITILYPLPLSVVAPDGHHPLLWAMSTSIIMNGLDREHYALLTNTHRIPSG